MKKLKSIIEVLFWVGGMFCLLMMYSFTAKKQHDIQSQSINIRIKEGDGFVKRNGVYNTLIAKDLYHEKDFIKAYNTKEIEEEIHKNPFVNKVEAYFVMNGNMNVDIRPRIPVCRVMNKYGQQFYIDENMNKFPVSIEHTERVKVISGYIEEGLRKVDTIHTPELKAAVALAKFIEKDAFWKFQTAQILINQQGDLEIVPVVGNHQLVIGDAQNLKEKFKRLKIFYKEGLSKLGWSTYSSINVKFEGQIVCTRR
jgi:cell division protein FtsQ